MKKNSLFLKSLSGSFLVAGTAIGAGMLALPLATAQSGFLAALFIYAFCWLFSMATGLLMLEITLTMPEHSNLISMSVQHLGKFGKFLSWGLYLFLFYCLTIAYISGGASLLSSMFFGIDYYKMALVIFTCVFGGIVFFGAKAVDRVNFFLMIGLILSYIAFITLGVKFVQFKKLVYFNLPMAVAGLPVIFTSFSYQGILPTLTDYLQRDRKAIRMAIFVGSSIPFLAYILWDLLIKGIIPIPELIAAKQLGLSAVEPLSRMVKNPILAIAGQGFAFFALATSFLGVTLGLLDFLSDGLKISKNGLNRLFLCFLIYVPTAVVALIDPNIFFKALEYAGGIGCVLLLGLLPVLMVMKKRLKEIKTHKSLQELPGGNFMLLILIIFILFELGVTLS